MELTISAALEDFCDHQRAARRSPGTIGLYRRIIGQLEQWLASEGRPTSIGRVAKKDMVAWLNDCHDRLAPTTVAIHFRHARAFWNWLVKEGEIERSPMATMAHPSVPDIPPPVVSRDQMRALLKACEGQTFTDRRDMAILLVLLDTGSRLSELSGLRVDDFDRVARTLTVTGKGDRTRTVAVGDSTVDALARYVRIRRAHRQSASPALWLGKAGPLTPNGVDQMLRRRAATAQVDGIHAHLFRHTFAHEWLDSGGREGDLMMLGGWTSTEMPRRYGRSAAAERAREAHRTHSPADRLMG